MLKCTNMKRFLLYLLTVVSIVACSEGEPADNGSDDGGGTEME